MFLFGWPPSVALQYILNAFLHEKKKIVWVFLSQHRITLLLPLSLSFSCLLTIHSYQQWPEERVQSVKPAAKSLQLCPTLCNPKDCSPPGSYVQEILQARILEWVAMPCSRGSSLPRDWTQVSCIAGRFFTAEPPGKPINLFYVKAKDCRRPGV